MFLKSTISLLALTVSTLSICHGLCPERQEVEKQIPDLAAHGHVTIGGKTYELVDAVKAGDDYNKSLLPNKEELTRFLGNRKPDLHSTQAVMKINKNVESNACAYTFGVGSSTGNTGSRGVVALAEAAAPTHPDTHPAAEHGKKS